MLYSNIIEKNGIERIRQGKLIERPTLIIKNSGHAARDILAIDEHDAHPVDAISVHAFRRRQARFFLSGLNSKLVHLSVPRR